jgi:nucleoid-associated protein YgaU
MSVFCGDPIPVEELGNAKHEISRAESVKADKYAPEKLQASRDAIIASHELVTNSKLKEAKEKAIEAEKLAKEAYDASAPLLAKDTKAEAEEILLKAENAYAEEYAREPYNNARQSLTAGDDKFGKSDYYNAFLDYETAREEAIKARNLSEAQAETLSRDIAAANEKLKEAIQYGARDSSPDKVSESERLLASASGSVQQMMLKDAHQSLAIANQNIDEATQAAKSNWAAKKKIEATGAVEKAESDMVALKNQLEDAKLKKAFTESEPAQNTLRNAEEALSAAQESLAKANENLEAKKYNESYQNSEEAIRLSAMVEDQIPQLMVMLNDTMLASENVAANKGGTSTATTETAVVKTEDTSAGIQEGWKKYTVRLIPQRRDCLWRIAEYDSIYGNPRLWPRIYKANKAKIRNPDLIFPGQVFDIPPKSGSTTKSQASEKVIEKPKMESNQSAPGNNADTGVVNP